MTLKRVMTMAVICAGLVGAAAPASAQEWWSPRGWMRPAYPMDGYRTFGYRMGSGYGANCPNGVCPPRRYGYGAGYAPGNTCGPDGCDCRCANCRCSRGRGGDMRNWQPGFEPMIPEERAVPNTWGTGYRGLRRDRAEFNPFYE